VVLGRREAFGLLHVVPQLAPHLLRGLATRVARSEAAVEIDLTGRDAGAVRS